MEKTQVVIFGATGDLAKHKLFPALFEIFKKNKLVDVLGIGRKEFTNESFINTLQIPPSEEWNTFSKQITYIQGNFTEKSLYEKIMKNLSSQNILYYLAVEPSNFPIIINFLYDTKLNFLTSRIIIEKPFGTDKTTATKLFQDVNRVFDDKQVFIIDHYLGKETIQNIFAFRFANSIFEQLWNKQYIDSIQICVSEAAGTAGRGGYYDKAGAIKDMLQSHLLQILAAICMEPPDSFNPLDISAVRTNLIFSLEHFQKYDDALLKKRIVLGQYEGYKQEDKVAPDSFTETFISLKTFIENERWKNVPIYLRTGKHLPLRTTEIYIIFKNAIQNMLFPMQKHTNILAFRIQPNEGISLKLYLKEPGEKMQLKEVSMDFCYQDTFAVSDNAHIRLLEDAIQINKTLFTSINEIIASWEFVEPIEQYRNRNKLMVLPYAKETWGPTNSRLLLENDNRHWQSLYPYKCDINILI